MQSPPHSPNTTITATTITTTTTTTNNHQETSTFTTTTKTQLPQQCPCPRCQSPNTRFCYYNNYNSSQPRHFCKSRRRHWTHGGVLRDIHIGGGTSKNAKRRKLINLTSGYVATSSLVKYRSLVPHAPVDATGNVMVLFEGNGFMSLLGLGEFEGGVWPFCGN